MGQWLGGPLGLKAGGATLAWLNSGMTHFDGLSPKIFFEKSMRHVAISDAEGSAVEELP